MSLVISGVMTSDKLCIDCTRGNLVIYDDGVGSYIHVVIFRMNKNPKVGCLI